MTRHILENCVGLTQMTEIKGLHRAKDYE